MPEIPVNINYDVPKFKLVPESISTVPPVSSVQAGYTGYNHVSRETSNRSFIPLWIVLMICATIFAVIYLKSTDKTVVLKNGQKVYDEETGLIHNDDIESKKLDVDLEKERLKCAKSKTGKKYYSSPKSETYNYYLEQSQTQQAPPIVFPPPPTEPEKQLEQTPKIKKSDEDLIKEKSRPGGDKFDQAP